MRRRIVHRVALALVLFAAACGGRGPEHQPEDAGEPGPYPVGVTRVELYDAARDRTLLTEVWYPADESARGLPAAPIESYLPPELAAIAANATIPLVAVRDVAISPDRPFPLIAFSHGSGGIRFQNTFQMEYLASHGFVVAAPDHQGNTVFDNSGSDAQLSIDRPLDILFVFDQLSAFTNESGNPFEGWIDLNKGFGVTGHSFGAFTTLAVASTDQRVVAALPMALGGPVSDSYTAATLMLIASEDQTIGLEGNDAARETYAMLPSPRFFGEVIDAGHFSFSFACQTGLGIGDGDGCKTGERLDGSGTVTFVADMRVWDLVNGYSAALFGRYIDGIDAYDVFLAENQDPEILHYTAGDDLPSTAVEDAPLRAVD
jgi:predicted dienelactone hydrolase